MFGTTNIAKNNDKEKYVHNDYRIPFDGKVSWSFDNDFTKKNFLAEGDTFSINRSFVCGFSVEYDAIDKSDIFNIHIQLMANNNRQKCLGLLNNSKFW